MVPYEIPVQLSLLV